MVESLLKDICDFAKKTCIVNSTLGMRYREPLNESERPKVEEKCSECQCGGSDYRVCFKQNTETGTIHIFCCNCEEDSYGDCKFTCPAICLCNCIDRAEHSKFELIDRVCYPLEKARVKAAELQNQGYKVCGVCVSALYHNGL